MPCLCIRLLICLELSINICVICKYLTLRITRLVSNNLSHNLHLKVYSNMNNDLSAEAYKTNETEIKCLEPT